MASYLRSAIAFIQDNGDELERARLAGLLGRSRPDPKAARALLGRQGEDGGFPYGMFTGRPSAVTATATALQWMTDLRLLPSPHVERAAGYLLTVQRPDGSWDEAPAVIKFDPPAHLRPGHPAGRAYCTGVAAFWMTRLLGSRHDAVQRAAAYLRAQRADDWPEDDPADTTSLVTATFAMVEGPTAEITRAGFEALGESQADVWTDDRLAAALNALYTAGFNANEPLVAWGLERLASVQRPNGGWSSMRGADHDVDVSLGALGALLAFGVPSG